MLLIFSMIWIISLDFHKIIQSTRWCSSMLRWWIRFRDCFSKWKKINEFSRKIMFLCMDFPEFSYYLRWLCRVWVNWSHGSQGRMKNILYFSTSLDVVVIIKNCLGPVTIVLTTENIYAEISSQIFPNPASTYLESVS